MPKHVSSYYALEQPINWTRAFSCGVLGAFIMMSWIDIFAMMGFTPFTLEVYVGTLLRNSTENLPRAWIWGFFFNLGFGGILGILYSYFFEYIFVRTGARLGAWMGMVHTFIAGVAILPFFETVHQQMGLQLYHHGLGFLGSGLGPTTPLILFVGHILFGSSMGLFYGPVREDRILTRNFEPGEVGLSTDPDVITPIEDPVEATPSVPYHAPGSAFPRTRGGGNLFKRKPPQSA
jgi:hypothetical protein